MEDSERFVAEIRAEFPEFRMVPKSESTLCRAIDLALKLLTLGKQNQFQTVYHTVIGNTLYLPDAWNHTPDIDRVIVLRHERIHLRQRRRYGMLLMAFIYLVPIVPIGLAYGRARLEWEAYAETLRATAELKGLNVARSEGLRRAIISRFTGAAYAWMWPFPSQVERWYDTVLTELSSRPELPS